MSEPRFELNWGTIRSAGFAGVFESAARTGWQLITATYWMYEKALAEGATDAELAARARECGVGIGYLDGAVRALPGVPGRPGEMDESFEQAVRFADTFGVRTLNVTHFTGAPDVDFAELAEAVGRVATRAAAEGLAVVFEFLPGTGIPDLATGVRLVDAVGADNFSLLFDTWHHWRSGGRLPDLEALDPRYIGACQLADVPADRIDTFRADDPEAIERNARLYVPMTGRLLPGDGVLPLAEVVAWFRTHRPDVPLGAEIFSADLDAMSSDDAAATTLQAMRALL